VGGPHRDFATLDGAALEMGHRYVTLGARIRHLPWMLGDDAPSSVVALPFEDELRFAYYRFGRLWATWAIGRVLATGYVPRARALAAAARVLGSAKPTEPKPVHYELPPVGAADREARITVLIPTLDRREHLRRLLDQLRRQTLAPLEIIVVDQTPPERRDDRLAADFADLPLRLFHLDAPGQCSSRNVGLREACGDYILVLDDDDEIGPSLLETHVRNLRLADDEVSSGVAHEVGAGALPARFRYTRVSDVFPTNNTLVKRSVLCRSGLFDLAYERGQRADGDLGMRVYLSGALMVLNPAAAVLHHHASEGGLRTHKARVVTYASSRSRLSVRHLPTATEIYLARRYFTPRQVREAIWLRVFGTFAARGGLTRKLLKAASATIRLRDTLRSIRDTYEQSGRMLEEFPRIASLDASREAGQRSRATAAHLRER
jgi:glycosyltransferase involved in cell wall biosynthesis